MLGRAGLRVVPVPLSAWRRDRAACLAAVDAALAASVPGVASSGGVPPAADATPGQLSRPEGRG
ncbi:MAG: hypothetical protein MUF10_18165 [Thermoanaerobaculaceae bacterium]|nr:hypothetical protein [Thermoanaerobaculaceae bacterium]